MWLYSGIVLAVLGTGGADCAIQGGFAGWKSFYNITYLQDFLLTIWGGYLGNLFLLFLSMLMSAKTHSKALALAGLARPAGLLLLLLFPLGPDIGRRNHKGPLPPGQGQKLVRQQM